MALPFFEVGMKTRFPMLWPFAKQVCVCVSLWSPPKNISLAKPQGTYISNTHFLVTSKAAVINAQTYKRSPSPALRGLILQVQIDQAHYPIIRTCRLGRRKRIPHPEQHNPSGHVRQPVNTEGPYFYLLHKICSVHTSLWYLIK